MQDKENAARLMRGDYVYRCEEWGLFSPCLGRFRGVRDPAA